MTLRVALIAALFLIACGQVPGPDRGTSGADAANGSPKRVAAAMLGEPTTLSATISHSGAGRVAGIDQVELLLHVGLATFDEQGTLQPRLAVAVPTVENGLWRMLPDGRMEMTWKIRPDARWHDGNAFTSRDLVFTAEVAQDRQIAVFRHPGLDFLERVEAPDAQTVVATWAGPYIAADQLFAKFATPLPQHLLAAPYAEDKASFAQLPYWTQDFVGTGPYRLKELDRGSHVVLAANPGYVLGRPKIDEIEIRFIPDTTAMVASLLAGAIELTLGTSLSFEEAMQAADQWRSGQMVVAIDNAGGAVPLFPQLLDPSPPVVGNQAFRQALMRAIDRQEIVDTLFAGRSAVADLSIVGPGARAYHDVDSRIMRYPYDPSSAAATIGELGYVRGADGFFRSPSGEPLSVEIRTIVRQPLPKTMLAVAEYWQRIGVKVEPVVIPAQLATDREYRATFPAFEIVKLGGGLDDLAQYLHSTQVPTAQNRFSGKNRSRYADAHLDALLDRYAATIPWEERVTVLGDIAYQLTDQLVYMGLYYDVNPSMVGNRLKNISPSAWNAHEWDAS